KVLDLILSYAARFSKKIEPWIHPRLPWACGAVGRTCMALLMLIMSTILILPIPFMNTAPCLVMFLMAVGLSEDDGLFLLLAMTIASAASAAFIYITYVFYTLGLDGLMALKDKFLALF
ncbi:MAG TPA: exopolysaccharide biosynthesis protein, partial [Opitutales bacterium]|nr:exopolysaccharide biosynthesis protein [Opitutales bacterium]